MKRKGFRFSVRGAIAGAIVVVGAGIAAWWILGSDDNHAQGTEHKTRGMIREVTPARGGETPSPREEVPQAVEPDANARPTKVGEVVNGCIMMPGGKIHKMTGTAHSVTPRDPSQIFDNPAENQIAALLTMEPGDGIVGGPDRETFTEDFLKSTLVPIIVREDDPEDVKELKRAVNQAKIELKVAHDRGEDIVDVIEQSYEEFRRLEQYKLDLFSDVNDVSLNEEASDDDVADYLAAANKMLEAKGIAPLKENDFIRTKLEYDYRRRNDK